MQLYLVFVYNIILTHDDFLSMTNRITNLTKIFSTTEIASYLVIIKYPTFFVIAEIVIIVSAGWNKRAA